MNGLFGVYGKGKLRANPLIRPKNFLYGILGFKLVVVTWGKHFILWNIEVNYPSLVGAMYLQDDYRTGYSLIIMVYGSVRCGVFTQMVWRKNQNFFKINK